MFQRRSLLFVKLLGENLECAISMSRFHSIIDLRVYISYIVLFCMFGLDSLRTRALNNEFCWC